MQLKLYRFTFGGGDDEDFVIASSQDDAIILLAEENGVEPARIHASLKRKGSMITEYPLCRGYVVNIFCGDGGFSE